MKKIIYNLIKQLEALKDLIEQREEHFYDKSDKWQESEKGVEYEDKTLEMESKADELDALIEELKELL